MAITLKWCTIFATCAAAAAISCAIFPVQLSKAGISLGGFWLCIGLIAVTLVFGGAIIPAGTGCLVASVAPDLRQISSAFSMFCFQQLGYALAPLLSASIGEVTATIDEKAETSAWALSVATNPANSTAGNITLTQFLAAADEKAQLEARFLVVMLWGLFGVLFLGTAWRLALRRAASRGQPADPPEATMANGVSV
mmetsp:Transcript_41551/g.83290  ORF Transcript_41551/g.83290 Transcript_41551/m.83290 type:complete len:196 (-) Transcript_41551:175-762(-)